MEKNIIKDTVMMVSFGGLSESFHTASLTSLWSLLLAPSPNPTDAEPTSRDAGIIAGIIVCVALLVALILVVIFYRSVPNSALYC